MGNVVNFTPPRREVVVAVVYNSTMLGRYALVIVDPELGELHPCRYTDKKKLVETIAMLSDDAATRKFGFEVHDHSTGATLFISDNDNEIYR